MVAVKGLSVLAVLVSLAWAQADLISRRDLRSIQSRRLSQSCSTSNFCQSKAGGTYADPCSSSAFIQCSNGQTFVQQCPSGLVWDTSCTCCNYPSSKPTSPTPTPTPASPSPKSPPVSPPSSPSSSPSPTTPAPSSGEQAQLPANVVPSCEHVLSLSGLDGLADPSKG